MNRPRYGVDGWPYLLGLSGATAALAGVALAVPRLRAAAGIAAVLPGVPAFLGLRYVTKGKLQLRDLVLGQVGWEGAEVVVDLGAGGGLLGLGAAQRTTGTVHLVDLFVGKDLSGNAQSRLERNTAVLDLGDRVRVHKRDVRSTGLPDGTADVVLSSLCFHNLSEATSRRAALDEAVRLLRPGGTLVVTDLGERGHGIRSTAPRRWLQGHHVACARDVPATAAPRGAKGRFSPLTPGPSPAVSPADECWELDARRARWRLRARRVRRNASLR